jgi:hypothetical protein
MAFSLITRGYGYTIRFAGKSRSGEQENPATHGSEWQATPGGRRMGRPGDNAAVVMPADNGAAGERVSGG